MRHPARVPPSILSPSVLFVFFSPPTSPSVSPRAGYPPSSSFPCRVKFSPKMGEKWSAHPRPQVPPKLGEKKESLPRSAFFPQVVGKMEGESGWTPDRHKPWAVGLVSEMRETSPVLGMTFQCFRERLRRQPLRPQGNKQCLKGLCRNRKSLGPAKELSPSKGCATRSASCGNSAASTCNCPTSEFGTRECRNQTPANPLRGGAAGCRTPGSGAGLSEQVARRAG